MGATRPHPARMLRMAAHRLAVMVLIFGAMALTGCGKADKITKVIVTPRYPELSTPQNVMIALQRAYTSRDSVEYGLLFDNAYQGTSIDLHLPPDQQTRLFTKADEVHHVAVLAKSPTVTSVSLDFGPTLIRSTDSSDPVGWATIQLSYIQLAIIDVPNSFFLSQTNEYMDFKFRPTTPAPTSPTDTTWKIISWHELFNP